MSERVRRRRRRDGRDPAERDRLQRQPDAEDPLGADPVGHRTGERGDEHRRERPRQDPQARAERRVALHGLEELRQQEDRAEHPEEHEQRGEVRERERARCGRSVIGSIGDGARSSQATNAATSAKPSPSAVRISGLVQPCSLPRIRPQTIPNMPALTSADAGQVELAGRAVALGQPRQRERHEQDPDRDVEPEDVLPGEALDDGAADDRAERDREAADRTPGAEREAALRGRHGRREDRQRQRHHDRAAEALHGAGDVEHLDVRRERRGDRGEREDRRRRSRTCGAGRSGHRARLR